MCEATMPVSLASLMGPSARRWRGTGSCVGGGDPADLISGGSSAWPALGRSSTAGTLVAVGDGRLLSLAVARPVEDELVRGGLQPVDRGLDEYRVGHQSEPLDRLGIPPKSWRLRLCRLRLESGGFKGVW